MTGDIGRPVVTPAHMDAARAAVDAWAAERPGINTAGLAPLVAQVLADFYYAGYEEGVAGGRRIVANVVKEALHDEGLL